jgi:lipid II:glycine glycyltransferase (peptidoglycan interpeptide bridge formation enzyme)
MKHREDDHRLLLDLGFRKNPRIRSYHTRLIDLRPTEEVLLNHCSRKWRENLRRGSRGEYEIVTGMDELILNDFLKLYRQMHERKDFVERIDVEKFIQTQALLPPLLKLQAILCREEGGCSAGILYTDIGNSVIPLFSATADWALKLRRSYLMRWQLLLRAKRNAKVFFDQGGLNIERNPGSFHFKEGMGGEELDFLGHYDCGRNPFLIVLERSLFWIKNTRNTFRDKLNALRGVKNARA